MFRPVENLRTNLILEKIYYFICKRSATIDFIEELLKKAHT